MNEVPGQNENFSSGFSNRVIYTWPLFPHHTFCDFSFVYVEVTEASHHHCFLTSQQSSFSSVFCIINSTLCYNCWYISRIISIYIHMHWVTHWYICSLMLSSLTFLKAQSHNPNCNQLLFWCITQYYNFWDSHCESILTEIETLQSTSVFARKGFGICRLADWVLLLSPGFVYSGYMRLSGMRDFCSLLLDTTW